MSEPHQPDEVEEPAPLLGSWRRIYVAVVVYLAVLIGLFAWFTATFQQIRGLTA